MIPVDLITEQNLIDRFDALPESLQETLISPEKGHVIEQICAANHLADEEKILIIRQVIAFIIMGYAHSYDLSKELNETLELNNPKLSAALADEINAKIFAPIKSDIDKNYKPIVPEKKGPVSVTEIRRPPVKFSVTPGESSPEENRPEPIRIITEVQGPPSLRKMDFPSVFPKPQVPAGGIQKPPGPPAPAPAPAVPAMTPQEKPKMPGPVLLHEESEAAPAKRTADYPQKSVNQIEAANKFFSAQEGKPLPPKPARFGTGFEEKIPGSQSAPRVVHYTETRNDLPKPVAPMPPAVPQAPPRGQTPLPPAKGPELPPKQPAVIPPPPLPKTWTESMPSAIKPAPEKPVVPPLSQNPPIPPKMQSEKNG